MNPSPLQHVDFGLLMSLAEKCRRLKKMELGSYSAENSICAMGEQAREAWTNFVATICRFNPPLEEVLLPNFDRTAAHG